MKKQRKLTSVIGALISFVGVIMILASIGASILGIDRDAGWGPARTFLLGCGSLLAVTPYLPSMMRRMRTRLIALLPSSWLLRWQDTSYGSNLNRKLENLISSPQSFAPYRRKKKIDSYLTSIFLLTILIFTWIISVGRWVDWPDTTDYFHLQAQAFLSGQLHLIEEPSKQILQLTDPYTYENRVDIPYLWDASLYDGKYHLYWGPIPAVITAILESMLQVEVGDQYLAYIFTLGAIAFSLLVLRLIWNWIFPTLAAWTILPWAIMLCLGNPGPWLAGRPAVYEAAIASGQFFFAGGLYWFLLGLGRIRRRIQYNGLSGAFFIGAIASRITLLPGVLMLGVLGVTQLMSDDSNHEKIRKLFIRRYSIYYGLIMLGLIFLGWYNYARFGNVFEFGHRYQLTSWGMANSYQDFFSWRNVLPNFNNYFFKGYRTISVFPFVKPEWGVAGVPVFRAYAVANYHAEQVTGILITTPLLGVGLIPIYVALQRIWNWLDDSDLNIRAVFARFVSFKGYFVYAGMFFLSIALFLPISLISFNSMRYVFDITISVSILSAIGFGLILRLDKASAITKGLITFLAIFLSFYSSCIGILLGITSYAARFEHLNPGLFDQITRFFAF